MTARRSAAIGALLLACGGLALALVVAVQEFPRGLIALALVGLAVLGAWYGILRRGAARVAGLGVGALGLAAALLLMVTDHPPQGGSRRGRARAEPGLHARGLRRPRRPAPGAAAGAAGPVLQPEVRRRQGRTVLPGRPRPGRAGSSRSNSARRWDLELLVRDAVARGADGLAMAGGDGSQAVVADIAAELGLPYACVPAGTRNHFALDLGVDRDDVVGALDAFVDGGERRVDLAEVNGRVFVNNVSLGLYADAVQREGYREAKLRTLLDTVPELLGPDGSGLDLRWSGPKRPGAPCGGRDPGLQQPLPARTCRRLGHAPADRRRAPRDHDRGLADRPRQRRPRAPAALARMDRTGLRGQRRPSRSRRRRRRGTQARSAAALSDPPRRAARADRAPASRRLAIRPDARGLRGAHPLASSDRRRSRSQLITDDQPKECRWTSSR